EYQYAVGTSAGKSDVLSWKPTTETKITESDLNLINGQTYISQDNFSSGLLSSNSRKEGFIIFDTKEIPRTLTYKDFISGNGVSISIP
ncbi:hypothetical protein KKH56_00190, partial [bacterium]|nr:hypothetical protein [bacterium]